MTPTDIVNAFIAEWQQPDTFKTCVHRWFMADCAYENVGLSKPPGRTKRWPSSRRWAARWIWRRSVSTCSRGRRRRHGDDRAHRLSEEFGGATLFTIPLMGVFKIRDDKIAEWRDYFDVTPFRG